MVIAFWAVSILAFLWVMSKPKLRRRHGFFRIVFASVMLGLLASFLVILASVAILIFIIFVIFLLVMALMGFFFGKK